MYSSSEQLSHVSHVTHVSRMSNLAHDLVADHTALFSRSVAALVDAGLGMANSLTESNVDTLRTIFASSTVAARQCATQWLGAGGTYDWLSPVVVPPHLGWTSLPALPHGARAGREPSPGMAA